MSSKVPYDPSLLSVRRMTSVSSSLDEFLIGVSLLGAGPSTYDDFEAATVSITNGYSPNDGGTLIVDAETASVSLSFWDTPGTILYPKDRIIIRYNGETMFYGDVDSTSLTYTVDPAAARYGATKRVDFTATATSYYAVMMSRVITWKKLPSTETHIQRIRRWVTVHGF